MTDTTHIGTLRPSGHLEPPEGALLLTRIPPQAAQSPESAVLEIPPEQEGKLASAYARAIEAVGEVI